MGCVSTKDAKKHGLTVMEKKERERPITKNKKGDNTENNQNDKNKKNNEKLTNKGGLMKKSETINNE